MQFSFKKIVNFFNDSASTTSSTELKRLRKIFEKSKINLLTIEEAIKLIVDSFTPEQLKYLEILLDDHVSSFEEQLLLCFVDYETRPTIKIKEIQELMKCTIDKYKELFELKEKTPAN